MVGQSIQQGTGEAFRPEGFSPFIEGQVAGDQRGAALIALRDQLKQQLSSGFAERHEAQFVDNQQLVAV